MTSDVLRAIREILATELFSIGDTPVTVSTLLAAFLLLILTVWIAAMIRRTVYRILTHRGGKPSVVGTVSGLVYYTLLLTGFGIALGTAGIDLTALFAAGAIFAVALGFAMQSIAQNFVAGVILLAERSIKPGDLIEVEGNIVKVLEMGIRASVVRTRDGEDVIIPNSVLIQTSVKNYTLRDQAVRIRVPVGVVYRSDMELVKRTLTEVVEQVSSKWGVEGHRPQVVMTAFGNHSVNWEVGVWINDPWEWRPAVSAVHEAIWWAFRERGIVIAFPQLDVHLDEPVEASLRQLAGRAA